MKTHRTIGITLLAVFLCGHLLADSKVRPGPRGYSSDLPPHPQRPAYCAEVYPPDAHLNPTNKPMCYFYRAVRSRPGHKLDATLLWTGPLVNMPEYVLVPRDGKALVSVDNYWSNGYGKCLVFYDSKGTLLSSYELSDFFSAEEIAALPQSVSNRGWISDEAFWFWENNKVLSLFLSSPITGQRKEYYFDLRTGDLTTRPANRQDRYRGAVRHVPLWFSSLTELMHEKRKADSTEGETAQSPAGDVLKAATTRSVVCVQAKEGFDPETGSDLLAELNSHLPYRITERNFISKKKTGGLIGWAIVQNVKQKDILTEKLETSKTLNLLQVEKMTPEFESIMKQEKESKKQ